MAFEYYTFPVLLIGIAFALYFWQEPRMKGLENGRKHLLKKLIDDLFGSGNLDDARAAVHKLLHEGYMANKDLLMPIKKFLPYRRIIRWLIAATSVATLCALFQKQLAQVIITVWILDFSINDLLTATIVFLCAMPTKLIWEEFRYMQRIISLFDSHDADSHES